MNNTESKLQAYMPWFGRDFFNELAGYDHPIIAGSMRAIWGYWSGGCEGLEANDDYLSRLCQASAKDWPHMRSVIFDNRHFFLKEKDGRWHHPKTRALHKVTLAKHKSAVERGRKGAAERYG